MKIFTVGYGGKTYEGLMELLKENKISTIIDVRSIPFSKWLPKLCGGYLIEHVTTDYKIKYVQMGDKVGGRLESVKIEKNIPYLIKYISTIKKGNVVLMCAEKDYNQCHRYKEIGLRLEKKGFNVAHI